MTDGALSDDDLQAEAPSYSTTQPRIRPKPLSSPLVHLDFLSVPITPTTYPGSFGIVKMFSFIADGLT